MRLCRSLWLHLFLLLALCAAPITSNAQIGLGEVSGLEQGAPIKKIDSLRFQLDVLLAAERESIKNLKDGYRRALGKLESELQSAGKLQELLVVREELKKFTADPEAYLPPEPTEQEPGIRDLEQLRSTYRRERLRRNAEVARQSQAPLVKVKDELQALQVELTKANRIDDALLAVQTIEQINKRLVGIENGVIPAYFGDPLPKTKEQLEQFLVGTKWVSGWGAYLELLPEGNCRQSTMNPVGPWHALSSNRAARRGAKGVPLQMIFQEDYSFFIQPPQKRFHIVRMPSAPQRTGSWGPNELEDFLLGSVWVKDDTDEWVTIFFAKEEVFASNAKTSPWEPLTGLKATRGTGTNRISMAFSRDLRSFEQVAPGDKGRASFRLVGKASIPEN